MAPALVLLHGFTNTGASWSPVREQLGERYRAIAPDIRGHGGSSELEPVTLEAVLSDVERLVDGPFTLAGYSMGGRIALHYALSRSDRVQRLVLVGASPGIADAAERAERRLADERLADELEHSTIGEFAARWEQTPVLAEQPAEVRRAARADRLHNTTGGLARALRGLGTGVLPSVWDRLAELTMPVVLIVGERDRKFRAVAEQMARAIPSASIELISGAGHAVHLEAPELVAALLADDR